MIEPRKQILDFIVIGAQKAGTTSLFEYIRRHPELSIPASKESPYFSHDDTVEAGWQNYLRREFALATPGTKWGTVTPQYMAGGLLPPLDPTVSHQPSDERTVPDRIHALLPDVKIVALLRDPVERALSHHAMAMMNGWDTRPAGQAIAAQLRSEALREARRVPDETNSYVTRGEYGRILGAYFEVFPRDQIRIFYMADLERDPRSVLRTVFEFLQLENLTFAPGNLGTVYRRGGERRWLRHTGMTRLRTVASGSRATRYVWNRLSEPQRARIEWRYHRVNYHVELLNRRGGSRWRPTVLPSDAALRDHYLSDTQALTRLLGAPPPWG